MKSYDPKKEPKHVIYLDVNMVMQCLKFLPKSGFKWIDPKEFELFKYNNNSSKDGVFEVNLKYPKELRELHSRIPNIIFSHLIHFLRFLQSHQH